VGYYDTAKPMIADQLCGELKYFHFMTYIETRRGLVEYQSARCLGKRPGNADPLPFTPRQGRNPSVADADHVTLSHGFFDGIAVGSRQAANGANMREAAKRHGLVHAQRKGRFFALRDDTNVSRKLSARPVRSWAPNRPHRSRRRFQEPKEQP